MAAIKSTKKAKATKPSKTKGIASKKAVAKKTKKATKPAKKSSVKKTGVAKSSKKKTTVKKSSAKKSVAKTKKTKKSKKTAVKNAVNSFLADVIKQASKTQKAAQAQTKTWIKDLSNQDKHIGQLNKQLDQLNKKPSSAAKGKSRTSLDAKINKLQDQMSATRSGLLGAENDADKIATFIEWTSQLVAKPNASLFIQTRSSSSRPTLVKSNFASLEEFPEELEEDDDDMNFVFGDDDDMDEETKRK